MPIANDVANEDSEDLGDIKELALGGLGVGTGTRYLPELAGIPPTCRYKTG